MFEVINPRSHNTYIRTDAQGGPFNPVTPHEINEMKEEILWNKHFYYDRWKVDFL